MGSGFPPPFLLQLSHDLRHLQNIFAKTKIFTFFIIFLSIKYKLSDFSGYKSKNKILYLQFIKISEQW